MIEHSIVKKKSWKRDEVSLKNLLPFFGNYVLEDITPDLIAKYKTKRYIDGVMPASINRELALMKHAYNLSTKEWQWCKENPVCKVRMERENN